MIPKKIRRTIIVNGQEWEYCITGSIMVFAKNIKTKEVITWYDEQYDFGITPSDIKTLIEKKELFGVKSR